MKSSDNSEQFVNKRNKSRNFLISLEYYLKVESIQQSKGRYFFMDVLKVSAKSNPNSVAGALAGVLRERGGAELQAIGAGALNQAIKAVAIARGFVAPSGVDLICIPAFTDIVIDGEDRTAIKLIVEPR
jgi:stage V sporulation protein S